MQVIKQHKEKMRPPPHQKKKKKKTQRTPGRIKRNN